MILVGNKIDLQGQRKIKVEEGEMLASQLNIPYVETSAKFDTMVEKSFQTIATEIMIKENQKKSRESTRSPTVSKKEVTEVDKSSKSPPVSEVKKAETKLTQHEGPKKFTKVNAVENDSKHDLIANSPKPNQDETKNKANYVSQNGEDKRMDQITRVLKQVNDMNDKNRFANAWSYVKQQIKNDSEQKEL